MTVRNNLNNYASDGNEDQDKSGSDGPSTSDHVSTPKHSISGQSDVSETFDTGSEGEIENFEGLLKICGEASRWQFQIFLLTSFCGFCTALHNLIYAFVGAIPPHWCNLPEVDGVAYDEIKSLLIPRNKDGDFESCKRYSYELDGGQFSVFPNRTIDCDIHTFDNSTFRNTIVTEFDLVCGDTFYASTVQAMYMLGILCGSPIFGALSDQLGRKKAILIGTVIFILAGPVVAFSPNFYILMLARFILAAASPGIYGTSFVLVIEVLGSDWRGLAGNLFCLPFALGYMVLPGVAYYVRDWRHLQLALSAPSVILIFTWWFLPESPRWLLRKGRIVEAENILRQAAETNGRKKTLPSNFSTLVSKIADFEKEDFVKIQWGQRVASVLNGYVSLFRSSKLRVRTLVIYFCWASISMIYYGVALNSPNLSADRYLYTFIGGVLEVPSYFMVPPLIKYFGRRPVFCGFLLITSASLLASLLFDSDSQMVVVLALFGKLVIGGAYSLVYLYATEVMPTLLRTYGLGTASMVGRLGSIAAPYVVDLLGSENNTYPSIVFGTVALAAGLLSILLPETRNRRLPETVEDIEFDKV